MASKKATRLTSTLKEPTIADHWYLLLRAYMKLGAFRLARTAMKYAVREAPSIQAFSITIGIIYSYLGEYGDAFAAFFEASRLDPSQYLTLYNLVVLVSLPSSLFLAIFH